MKTTVNLYSKVSKFKFIINEAFGKYLLVTNTVSASVLMAVGDCVEQVVELKYDKHPVGSFDMTRMNNMAFVGLLIGIPQHYFYKYMDSYLPGHSKTTCFKKILLDQLICSPATIGLFFYTLGLLEHGNFAYGHYEFKKKFFTVYTVDWLFWPPTQFINFFFLTPKYRVIYVNGVTMIYDIFLSYVKHALPSSDKTP